MADWNGILNFDMNDPKTAGLLNIGLGILMGNTGRPGDLGQGVLQGVGNYQNMMAQQQRQKLLEQQQQMQNEQFNWTKQDREREQAQREAQAKAYQGIAQQYSIDPAVLQSFPDIGKDILKRQMLPQAPKIAFTPSGVAYDENNPTLQLGENYAKPEAKPSAIQEYEYARGQGFSGSFNDFQLKQKRAGASNVNVSMNTDKKYGEILGSKLAEQDAAAIDAARSAPARLDNARMVKQVLQANPITGTGAEYRLAANKALATAGIIDGTQVKNTEDLASLLASSTLDAIKTSGLGGGQGFTDKDRQFLEKARSGNIEINAQTLNTLADLNERAALATIKRGNDVIKQIQTDPNSGDVGKRLQPIAVPQASQPKAQKSVVRRGRYNGRNVIQYSDGSVEYAN
jgi:Sec-independent protein translocase protein TatA